MNSLLNLNFQLPDSHHKPKPLYSRFLSQFNISFEALSSYLLKPSYIVLRRPSPEDQKKVEDESFYYIPRYKQPSPLLVYICRFRFTILALNLARKFLALLPNSHFHRPDGDIEIPKNLLGK